MTDHEDGIDPRHLPNSWRPSVVHFTDDEPLFVANARILDDNGWLRIRGWANSIAHIPPRRIERVERVTVERTSKNNTATLAVADDDLRRKAEEIATGRPRADPREVIADD
jgi:hypothetical protein